MKVISDQAIVLRRVNYAEADRVVSCLTQQHGRVDLLAKGCRKPISKLAGGIEPLSLNKISWFDSNRDLKQLRSARSDKFYDNILKDYSYLELAYNFIESISRSTAHQHDEQEFNLLNEVLEQLNDHQPLPLIEAWFYWQLLQLNGYDLDLQKDVNDEPLQDNQNYKLDVVEGSLTISANGSINANTIKAFRLLKRALPSELTSINGLVEIAPQLAKDLKQLYNYHL